MTQTARREYGHHKFAIEAERRRREGAPVVSYPIQEAAARAVSIPVPPGIRVQDSVLVDAIAGFVDPLPPIPVPPPPPRRAPRPARVEPPEDSRDQALRAVPRHAAPYVSSGDVLRIVDTVQGVVRQEVTVADSHPALVPPPPLWSPQARAEADKQFALQMQREPNPIELPDPMPPMENPELGDLPVGQHTFEFLCGTAGTGKTWLARKLAELMNRDAPGSCVLAATTGIAAVNLGEGTTIHSLLGFFDTDDLREKYITGRIQLMIRKHRKAGLRRIILDEVSMLNADQLTYLTRAVEDVNLGKKSGMEAIGEVDDEPEPPGQPQVGLTLVGDFAQLAPVPDEDKHQPAKKTPIKYAFESVEWAKYAQHTTRLTKVRRQDAADFVSALHAVRGGRIAEALRFFSADRFSDVTDTGFEGTTIFAKNVEVDRYNQDRLDRIAGELVTARTERWGKQRNDWKKIPDQVDLKVGALVMILANRRAEPPSRRILYANGDLGTITGRKSDLVWKVRLQRTGAEVEVVMVSRDNTIPMPSAARKQELIKEGLSHRITEDGKYEIVGTIVYMPLRCAYGCTVHKTQGLTLDRVQVNIRDYMFKQPGMTFVALSRARTAAGLRIVGNQQLFAERCRVESRVQPWL